MEIKIGKDTSEIIRNATTVARVVKKTMGRNSLTRMASDSIFQFPLLMSSSINTEDSTVISRAIERQYASLLVSVFSLNGAISLKKYENIQSYLKNFHNNKDIPSNIRGGLRHVFESASLHQDPSIPSGLGAACWDIIEDQVNIESINNLYKPYERTKKVLRDKIDMANESSVSQKLKDTATKLNQDNERDRFAGLNRDHKSALSAPAVARNDKLTALEPTMINVQFVMYGEKQGQVTQNVVLGVKTMIRQIRSDIMVANMADAAKDSFSIFKFIKWTKGEYKFFQDFVFNITDIKDMATSSKDSTRWISALKRRKAINNIGKYFKNSVLPNTTIILTSYEIEEIAGLSGVNLSEVHNALKLVAKYYLLGFGIYDVESKTLSMLFDGETDFSSSSIAALKSNNNRDVDLNNMKEVMKLMGRI